MQFMFLVIFLLLLSPVAHADQPPALLPPASSQSESRMEVDEKSGVIRFIINGREEARIDQSGLKVRQDITYGGSLTDSGPAHFDGPPASNPSQGQQK